MQPHSIRSTLPMFQTFPMATPEAQLLKSDNSSERPPTNLVDLTQDHTSLQSRHQARKRETKQTADSIVITPVSSVISNNQHKGHHTTARDSKSKGHGRAEADPDPLLETSSAWGQHAYLRAKQLLSPLDFEGYKNIMHAFEAKKESPAEVDATYQQISRLLDATSGAIPEADRIDVAVQILLHAAQPDGVGQGDHNTCAVAGLETREFARTPSRAAEVVATTALTGQWTAPDGKQIKLDPKGLVPGEEEMGLLGGYNRSLESQIFQLTMTNDILQRLKKPVFYTGTDDDTFTYANGEPAEFDGSKRLIGLPLNDVEQAGERDFGDSDFFLVNSSMAKSHNIPHGGLTEFGTVPDLEAQLRQTNKFPLLMAVDGRKLSGMGVPDHAIRLLAYDPKTGYITVSDPNFPGTTSEVSVEELFEASR
jgi:hypothetical protein